MDNSADDDAGARARHGRQVLAGSEVRPPADPINVGPRDQLLLPEQGAYLIGIAILLLIGLVLLGFWGVGVAASILLFLLAVALIAAWFVF